MAAFTHHLFICGNRREPGHSRGCCDPEGTDALRSALKAELQRRGLNAQIRANSAGCLDQCEFGPALVIYPQGIWYGNVQLDDIPQIVQHTLVEGRVLEHLAIPAELLNGKGAGADQWRARAACLRESAAGTSSPPATEAS